MLKAYQSGKRMKKELIPLVENNMVFGKIFVQYIVSSFLLKFLNAFAKYAYKKGKTLKRKRVLIDWKGFSGARSL